jgi:aminoacrylate hydrolase
MLHIEILGVQTPNAPTVVLSSGLSGLAHFWKPQLDALVSDYRVVVYDHLGTGASPAELPEDYSISDMAHELAQALDGLSITRYHIIGHALGGLIALELAKRFPQAIQSMILINAWAAPNAHTARCFSVRKKILTHIGPAAYIEAQSLFLYSPDWIATNEERLISEDTQALGHFPNPDNVLKRIDALLRFDARDYLHQIHVPTLLIANRDDHLIPWRCSQQLHDALPHSTLEIVAHGGHASSISEASSINALLKMHLKSHQPSLHSVEIGNH